MADVRGDATRAQIRIEEAQILRTRVRVGLGIALIALLLHAGGDLYLNQSVLQEILRLRILSIVMVTAALLALQLRRTRIWTTVVALAAVAGILTATATTGAILRDDATTSLLVIALATASATLLPWGTGPHAVIVVIGLTEALWNIRTVNNGMLLASTEPIGTLLIALGGSFFVRRELERTRLAVAEETIERRRVEENLRKSEERFALATQGANDGLWDWDMTTGEIYYSPRWEEMLGHAAGEIASTVDAWRIRVHPDDAERFTTELTAHVGRLLPHFENEHRLRHTDGRYRWMLARGLCVYDATGTPVRMAGSLTDITERKLIEKQLLHATADAQSILRAFPDVYFRLGVDGTVLDYHTRYAADLATELLLGRRVQDILSPELGQQLSAAIQEVLTTESVITREYVFPQSEGDLTFEVRILPLRGEQIILIARDITERKLTEEKARQHQAELAHVLRLGTMGEMAAELAHELNQPLAAIVSYAKGCVRRLQSGATQPAELADALEHISDQAVRGGEIIRRLRDFVRKEPPRRERIDLNRLVRDAGRFANTEARRYGISMRLALCPERLDVTVDAVQIEQVILNLVRNGLEAMYDPAAAGTGAELVIQTSANGGTTATIAVCDQGKGLPPAIVDQVFDPFFTTKPTGLGMGLSISRSIVESHGGRLWATPNPEQGTTFLFTVPMADGGQRHAD